MASHQYYARESGNKLSTWKRQKAVNSVQAAEMFAATLNPSGSAGQWRVDVRLEGVVTTYTVRAKVAYQASC